MDGAFPRWYGGFREKVSLRGQWEQLRVGPEAVERWKRARFACPPYHCKEKSCILRASGALDPPVATKREALLGFALDHTVPCVTSSEAKQGRALHEAKRRCLLGNSFQFLVVGWLVGHFLVRRGFVAAVPTPSFLPDNASSWKTGVHRWAPSLASLRERRICIFGAVELS